MHGGAPGGRLSVQEQAPQSFGWINNGNALARGRIAKGRADIHTLSAVPSTRRSKEYEVAMIAAVQREVENINGHA